MYKASVLDKIRENSRLRLKLGLALDITERSVVAALVPERKTLYDIRAVNVIKEELGLTEEELFEQEEPSAK